MTDEKREKRRRWSRKHDLERHYGLPVEALLAIQEAQGACCAICGERIDLWERRSGCVDHDHESGKVRGILCVKCNAGLGQFREKEALMLAAIQYLEKHRKKA